MFELEYIMLTYTVCVGPSTVNYYLPDSIQLELLASDSKYIKMDLSDLVIPVLLRYSYTIL